MMNIPSDIKEIELRARKKCNCNEVGFDLNLKQHKVVCTYKFLPGEHMCKLQIGYK